MATVNFSVPEEVKAEFNKVFAKKNKSAIITQLMRDAVEEHQRLERRSHAIDALLTTRQKMPSVNAATIRTAREKGRP